MQSPGLFPDPIAGAGQAARTFTLGGNHRSHQDFGVVAVTFVLFKELTELLGVRVAGHTRVGKFDEFPGGAFVIVGCEVLGHVGLSGRGKLQRRVTVLERRAASIGDHGGGLADAGRTVHEGGGGGVAGQVRAGVGYEEHFGPGNRSQREGPSRLSRRQATPRGKTPRNPPVLSTHRRGSPLPTAVNSQLTG